jgi:hypothetical protein
MTSNNFNLNNPSLLSRFYETIANYKPLFDERDIFLIQEKLQKYQREATRFLLINNKTAEVTS